MNKNDSEIKVSVTNRPPPSEEEVAKTAATFRRVVENVRQTVQRPVPGLGVTTFLSNLFTLANIRKLLALVAVAAGIVSVRAGHDVWGLVTTAVLAWILWPSRGDWAFVEEPGHFSLRVGPASQVFAEEEAEGEAEGESAPYWSVAHRQGEIVVQDSNGEIQIPSAKLRKLTGLDSRVELSGADCTRLLELATLMADQHNREAGYAVPESDE